MRKLLNHPWTIAVVGALLAVALAEVGPLHLVSRHVIPLCHAWLGLLNTRIATPAWIFIAAPCSGAALVVIALYTVNQLRRKGQKFIFSGLRWKRSITGSHQFWPICNKCAVPLQPRIEPEQRKDRNDMPFEYIPEYPNVLRCAGCNRSTYLTRPWDETLQEAEVFFSSLPKPDSITLVRKT